MISIRFIRTVQLGVKSLLLHKLRSGLTMLGIIFGVCSVISMLAIGEGASYEAQESIKKLGSNNIILRSLKPPDQEQEQGSGFVLEYGLTYDDARRIKETVSGVWRVLPKRIVRDNVRFGTSYIPVQVIGTYSFLPEVGGLELIAGRFLTATDERFQNNICAITSSLAQRLFPYQNPLEQAVKISSVYYQVVGIVEEQSITEKRPQAGETEGQPLDNNIYIPLSTSIARFGETIMRRTQGSFSAERIELHEITIQMHDTEGVEKADPQVKWALKHFHEETDYEVIVPLELLRQAEQTKRIFNIVLGSIACISLLVGGIGIMNIMLATVTERTREIGIRRALGAKKADIISQFLIETVVLSVGGGLVGVAIGIIVPIIVEHFSSMKTIITLSSVVFSFSISGAVGIVFGIYPASSAADLDPIEALRHE
ncbi:ABC transporter permease [Verrucomicrobia bacterium]|nr:ABC transporter permease [Verrucomicrobiota bacterium]